MSTISFKKTFINFCKKNKFEQNLNQIEIINLLDNFIKPKNKFMNFFSKSQEKLCFYLYGDVGVGKTMILNFFYDYINIPKKRSHFNEFMIKFHEFRHHNKQNSINAFVKTLKKNKLIYLDEFQVTNIVDAMILGELFKNVFSQNIKVLITSNTKIDDLYKDGLQREQFLPFIDIIRKNSIHKKLTINQDYRKKKLKKFVRTFYPINEKTTFKINQLFRELTKNKKKQKKTILVKSRKLIIENFYEGIAKFNFEFLCKNNFGAEDYIKISRICNFIIIENIPLFNDFNSNQQQRFITLIDIIYEKKIPLLISMEKELENLGTSKKLRSVFKRTLSRLVELTSKSTNLF